MKQLTTTPALLQSRTRRATLVAIAVVMAIATPLSFAGQVSADKYQDRINSLQSEINQYQSNAASLGQKANNLQAELDKITNEKATIQSQIDLSQAKYDKLTVDIKANEEKIKNSQEYLGKILASMYVDNKVSAIEMLASSQNVGDYVDKQEFRSSAQQQLTSTITQIKQLKAKLEQQKIDANIEIENGKNARAALAAKEAEQQQLVNQTRGEEAAYQGLANEREQQKAQAQKEQQAAIQAALRRGGGGGGLVVGGSLGSYAAWTGNCYVDGNAMSYSTDPLGYGCNQCVSYAAWKMMQVTGSGPSYWGNANQWPAKARAAGLKVSSQPRANSLGVISAGQYGHIVYVEGYNAGANTVSVTQYNEYIPGQGWGKYSERPNASANTYDTYIYL